MHTPSPWYVSAAEGAGYDISDAPPDANGECEHVIATVWGNRPSLTATAASDAALIAAAPDLLDALRQAVTALNVARRFTVGGTNSYAIASLCDRAISKAEGRTT